VEGDTVYCVFGPGWIAPLTKDMKALAERPRLLRVEDRRAGPGRQPLYAGRGGCQVFKQDGVYHLLATTEWGDVLEATSASLYGPYENRRLAFARTGPVTMFQGPQGQWLAAVSKPTP
jgi:hypothetical protein